MRRIAASALLSWMALFPSLATGATPRGAGCITNLLNYLERRGEAPWAVGCKISDNVCRFWCQNGRTFDHVNGVPAPLGGLRTLCEGNRGANERATAPGPEQPSFDCSKAKSASARLICGDPELSALDGQLAIPF